MENLRNLLDAQQDPPYTNTGFVRLVWPLDSEDATIAARRDAHYALQGSCPAWQQPAMDAQGFLCSLMVDCHLRPDALNCLSNAQLHLYGIHHTTGLMVWSWGECTYCNDSRLRMVNSTYYICDNPGCFQWDKPQTRDGKVVA